MIRVVHISADFPDPIEPSKTAVIRTLVNLTRYQIEHEVYSLNRQLPSIMSLAERFLRRKPLSVSFTSSPFKYGQFLKYEGAPLGILHATYLRRFAEQLANRLSSDIPDVIIGHKLTVEGLVAEHVATLLDIPFACCIQGDTDTKILSARRDLAKEFERIFHRAAVIFPFSPWAMKVFENRLGVRVGQTKLLPCPTELDRSIAPTVGGNGLLSVFHLQSFRRKNLRGLLLAMAMVRKHTPATIAIVGGGTEKAFRQARFLARCVDGVTFEGALSGTELAKRMNQAIGFVLPSIRESFGLVFIEALFAGLPVVYPKGMAIDGYFDNAPFAIAVEAQDPKSIATGIMRLIEEEASMKIALREWQMSDHANQFTRQVIGTTFAKGLIDATRI